MKTTKFKASEIKRKWHSIDASGKVLGRLSTQVTDLLRGKKQKYFSPDVDCGDFVVLTNVSKVVLTGNKLDQKTHYTHSGYPGGDKYIVYRKLMQDSPEKAVMYAVKGMLPKNKLGRRQLKRLRVFKGAEHSHGAQLAGSEKQSKDSAKT